MSSRTVTDWIESGRAAREAEYSRLADARADAQLESLELGHSRRVDRIDHRLAGANEARIERMLTSQQQNLEQRFERKRNEIASRRQLVVNYDRVAAGVVRVIASLGPANGAQSVRTDAGERPRTGREI